VSADASSDRALVAAYLSGRGEAEFRRLYAAHAPRLYLWLLRLCGGREAEAEDLMQETWLRAAAKLAEFRWESALSTWLGGIGWNAYREASRRSPRRILAAAPEKTGPEPIAASDRGEPAAHVDLERALRDLPDGYREVFVLHDVEGYTHDEIAQLLGIAPGTSKSQLARAREWLRRRLGSGGAFEKGKSS
jgi:RNA polymerase sigma-70 factor (ECF subfamily)